MLHGLALQWPRRDWKPPAPMKQSGRDNYWKTLFGSSLDGLAVHASLSDEPAHLRDSICGAVIAKSTLDKFTRRRGLRSKLYKLNAGHRSQHQRLD
jgi:hypothetical protein